MTTYVTPQGVSIVTTEKAARAIGYKAASKSPEKPSDEKPASKKPARKSRGKQQSDDE